MSKMPDLDIKNDTGSIWIEHEGKGILIYFEAEIHPTLPPNHIRFNKQEKMKLIKWLVTMNLDIVGKNDYSTELSTELDKVIEEEMKNKPKDIMK